VGAADAAAIAGVLLVFTGPRRAVDRTQRADVVGAILRRRIVYGAADGVLRPVFPILAVFGLFAAKERADAGNAEPARTPIAHCL
jgi:hypothetical protein